MLGRRGVLAGALGLAALSACDVDDLRPPEDEPTPTASPTATTSSEPDSDQQIADYVGHRLATMGRVVDDTRKAFPRLRARLQPLARMHRAHLEVLPAPDGDEIPPMAPVDGTAAEALAYLLAQEGTLQKSLADLAGGVQSGALARLLASMSASVSQHLAALPAPATDGRPS